MVRKFKKVAKTKKGVPKKYVQGAKNPKAQEAEINGDTTTAEAKRTEATTKYNEAKAALLAL